MAKEYYRKDIDGLRAVAVFAVIFFHLKINFLDWFKFNGGFIGVDVFFVISGFLISSIVFSEIEKKKFSIKNFYNRRARRILPIFVLVGFLSSIFSFYLFLPGDLQEFSNSLISGIFFSSNFFFWQNTGYFFADNELKPLIHTWSLSVEEQFYILFPIFILISFRYFKQLITPLLLIVLVLSLVLAHIESSNGSAGSFFLLPTRAWELVAGILCTIILKKNIYFPRLLREFLSSIGLSFIIFSIFIFEEEMTHPGFVTLIPVLGTMLIIIFCNKNLFLYKILGNRFLVFNGLISYSLYMWHQPIIAFLSYTGEINSFSTKISIIFFLISISFLSWKFIEVPTRNKEIINNKIYYLVSSFCIIILISISSLGILSKGLLSNYPEKDHNLLLNKQQYGKYVWKKSSSIEIKEFSDTSKKKVIVVGDSYSQDLINSFIESGYESEIELSWYGINFECKKPIFDIKCLSRNLKIQEDLKKLINEADVIFLAMSWGRQQLRDVDKIFLEDEFNFFSKKLILVGSKQFELINEKRWTRKDLLKLKDPERLNLKTKISKELIYVNNLMKKNYEKKFISLIDILCDENLQCNLFDENSALISYDGSHFTKAGARYLGEKLKKNEIIREKLFQKF